ncbi:MAG: triose-phosphate isomerase [Thermoplasmata archaeon]|nr:triose-phosphate isomerase [Thermoplasmata archaeon]
MSTEPAPLGAPLLVLNLKAYPNAVGPGAERIGRHLERLGTAAGVAVALAPSSSDLRWLAHHLRIPVLAQHADPEPAGARTGSLVVEAIAAAGARGSLVNHSERPLRFDAARAVVERLDELRLVPIVCAPNVAAARRLAILRPAYLAVEPPELIGGDRSVSTARPEVIRDAVRAVRGVSPTTRVLCGAGVHDREDVRRALELGSAGILVASAVTKAPNPAAAIRELLRGYPAP